MWLSRLRRENDVIDEVTIHHLSIIDGNTSQENLKRRRIVNFVIMYNVNKCAIYITLNSTISMKSCRKCLKIRYAQCTYTFVLQNVYIGFVHSFISLESHFLKISCFNIRSPRHEFGRPALSILFSDKRILETEIKWQLLQTLFILQNIIK